MPETGLDPLLDGRGRPLHDLRVSVTDRCNFRCRYCMPRERFDSALRFLPKSELLSFEEIAALAAELARLGVRKLRLTGGEPLLRAELPELVRRLALIPDLELSLTSNGSLLAEQAAELRRAGLRRATVSLDALSDAVFRQLNDTPLPVSRVLAGIEAAAAAGLGPVKVNTVVRRGVNDDQIVPLAAHFRGSGQVLRFIEYMDVGTTNGWRPEHVVSAAEILERLSRVFRLEPVAPAYRGEVARRYRYSDGSGEIGIISSVSAPFCGDCTRLRLSADGKLYTCLFASGGVDLKRALRAESGLSGAVELVRATWTSRQDRYSELRSQPVLVPLGRRRIEMSYIGG